LDIAAATCDELSQLPNDAKPIRDRSKQYYALVGNIQTKLTVQIERIPDQPRFQHSVYLSRKQAEIAYMKTQVVANELSKIVHFFEEKVPISANNSLTNIMTSPNANNNNTTTNNTIPSVTTPQQSTTAVQRPSTPNNSNINNANQKRT